MKFEEWLSQQDGVIEVDCGCVTAEAFYHWMRVAYEAGNSPAQGGPRCSIKAAPALDSFKKNDDARCGNSPVIPEGYVMVPKEPTKEMIDAGWLHFMGTKNPSSKGTYKAMLAAAPQEAQGE